MGNLLKKKCVIVKGNKLIEGLSDLSFMEIKLVIKIISLVDSVNDTDFKTYILSKKELLEYLKLGRNYKKLNTILEEVPYKKVILIENDEEKGVSRETCYWFMVKKYTTYATFRLDPHLKPYLLNLQDNFTKYDFKAIADFSCKYSFKIFEICLMSYNKQKKYKQKVVINLDILYLRKFLFLEDKYIPIPNFLKRVIIPSIQDINQYTNIFVSYDKILKGRITMGFTFTIIKNESTKKLFELNVKDKESISDEFNEIWRVYPLRIGINDISHKQKIQICKIGFEKFKIIIDRYNNYVNERRKEFPTFNFMEGATFFKGRYMDFTDENYVKYRATINKNNLNKPEQSTNFEQREYSEEFFESLYD